MTRRTGDNYLRKSIAFEGQAFGYIQHCQTICSDPNTDASTRACAHRLIARMREELRRATRAREYYLSMQNRSVWEIAEVLACAGLADHAAALTTGNWARQGLAVDFLP